IVSPETTVCSTPETGSIFKFCSALSVEFLVRSFSQRIVSSETPNSAAIDETVSPSLTSYSRVLSRGFSEIMVTGVIVDEITFCSESTSPEAAIKGFAGTPGYEPEITEVDDSKPPETKTPTAITITEAWTNAGVFAPRLAKSISTAKSLLLSKFKPADFRRADNQEAKALINSQNSLCNGSKSISSSSGKRQFPQRIYLYFTSLDNESRNSFRECSSIEKIYFNRCEVLAKNS